MFGFFSLESNLPGKRSPGNWVGHGRGTDIKDKKWRHILDCFIEKKMFDTQFLTFIQLV